MFFVDILSLHSLRKMQSEIPKDKSSKKKKDRTWVEAATIVSGLSLEMSGIVDDLPYRRFGFCWLLSCCLFILLHIRIR